MAYKCDLCSGAEGATFLMTPLTGGDTMAIGPECAVTGLCGLLSVAAGVDPEALYDWLLAAKAAEGQAPSDTAGSPTVAADASAGHKRAASVTPLPAGRTARPRATTKARGKPASPAASAGLESGPDIA